MNKIQFIILCCVIFSSKSVALPTDLIPTNDNSFYYQMGGGKSIAAPAYQGASSIPLHVEGDLGLGYNCGVFNPMLSITNSLNAIQNSFENIEQSVVNNATSAIAEFPMYVIARADPSLYNLLNNGLLGARKDFELSTKSCQAMQSEISKGQNPYANWASLSMGNDWKYQMSLAGNNSMTATQDSTSDDINQVKQKVDKDNGTNGVPWVHGQDIGRNAKYAGGDGQPPIILMHDTIIAGYNVILQAGRNYDDDSAPVHTDANAHLIDTFSNPKIAADWISNVLGDEKITTYNGGNKQSTAGVGLLSDIDKIMTEINQKLQNLVSNKDSLSIENLQAVSAPGVMINSAVINAIREQPAVSQSILIKKLSQEIATSKLIDKALLAKQILQEGRQVPAIYANSAAQVSLKQSSERLDQEINNLLFEVNVRKSLVSNTVTQLLNQTQHQVENHTLIQPNKPSTAVMNKGAIQKDNSNSGETTL